MRKLLAGTLFLFSTLTATAAPLALGQLSHRQPATFHIDSVAGTPAAGCGLISTPCSQIAVLPAFVDRDQFLFKDDSFYREKLTVRAAFVTISNYGGGAARPIFNGSANLTAGPWTETSPGSNIWTTPYTPSPDVPTPINLSTNGGTPTLKQANQAAIDADGEWFWADGVLSLGATADPSTFFTLVEADYSNGMLLAGYGVAPSNLTVTRAYQGILVSATALNATSVVSHFNSQNGWRATNGAHNAVLTDCEGNDNGLSSNEAGLKIGLSSVAEDVRNWTVNGGKWNRNGDGINVEAQLTPNTVLALTMNDGEITANRANGVDFKDALNILNNPNIDNTNGGDVPITIHVRAPRVIINSGTIRGRTNSSSNAQGITVDEGGVLEATAVSVFARDSSTISYGTTAGDGFVKASVLVKSGTGSTAFNLRMAGGTQTILNTTITPSTTALATTSIRIEGDGSVVLGNNIIYNPSNNTSRYALEQVAGATGTITQSFNNYFKNSTNWWNDKGVFRTEAYIDANVTGAVTADPLFVDFSTLDLTLQVTSPARGVGFNFGVLTDVDGVAYTNPPNMGGHALQ